jgi:hypothetical protein
MKTFRQYLEIALNSNFPELKIKSSGKRASTSKIVPTSEKTRIIPIKITSDVYNVFNKYINAKFDLVYGLMDRRGDGEDDVVVYSSNEELENLKSLAEFILANSNNQDEISSARRALGSIYQASKPQNY